MAKTLQFRRLSTTALANTVGANGELIVDSSNGTISVHDGRVSGGKRLATETYVVNTANQLITAAVPVRLGQLTNDFGYITSSASITGGSATAIRLFTPRYINGVAFDGTANIEVTISSANLTVNVSESLAQSAFAQANTASNTASSAQSNTIILQGVNTTQNTRLSVIEGGLISSNANTVFLNSLITTNNTRISVVEGGLISSNANTVFLNSLITTNNTRIAVVEGGLITANANSAYLTSVNTTQNTNITFATSLAQAAFDKANTGTSGGSSNVTIVTSDSFVGNGSNVAFTLSTTPSSKDYTIITFDGAVQLRSSYSLTANTITFTEAPLNGENIEVTSFSSSPTLATVTINTFTGDGSTVAYTLSVSPSSKDYTFVNFDGTAQLRSSYSLSGNILTFTEAPLVGENIEVTSFTTNSTSSGTTIGKAIAMSIIFGG